MAVAATVTPVSRRVDTHAARLEQALLDEGERHQGARPRPPSPAPATTIACARSSASAPSSSPRRPASAHRASAASARPTTYFSQGQARRRHAAASVTARGHVCAGSTRIFTCSSGWPRASKAPGTPSMSTVAGDHGRHVDLALGDGPQGAGELVGAVGQDELQRQLLGDGEERQDPVGLHAHADDAPRVPVGTSRRSCWSMPGTPTASKATSGRRPSTRRQASTAPSSGGSTTSAAPRVRAMARRTGEGSAATIDLDPRHAQSGHHGQAHGPAPHHHGAVAGRGTGAWPRRGCPPPAARSNAARRGSSPLGTSSASGADSSMTGRSRRGSRCCTPAGAAGRRQQHGHRHHVRPGRGAPVPGPSSTTSAQNSWPMTMSLDRSIGVPPMRRAAHGRRQSSVIATMAWPWRRKWRSEPQIPQARVRTSSWPASGRGSATSSTTSRPCRMTHARIGPSLLPARQA